RGAMSHARPSWCSADGSRSRSRDVAPLASLALALALAGCTTSPPDPWFRHEQPREQGTIYSPLDEPTPTTLRTASGAPGPAYWQQQADYAIDASLDPATRVVKGTEH